MPPLGSGAQQGARASGSNGLTRWIEENKNLAIALGIGTAVAGSAGAYYYFSGSSSGKGRAKKGSADDDAADEKGAAGGAAAASKKKKNKKKKAGARDGSDESSIPGTGGALLDEANDEDLHHLSEDEIKRLPEEKRKSLAQSLKTAGNKAYTKRQFNEAIDMYTKAIAAHPLAVFYSNRAACYSNLGRPADVVPDCNSALKMDKAYVKALNRRAVAKEQLGGKETDGDKSRTLLFESLSDFTAVAILQQFKDTSATESVERVLKQMAQSRARQILDTREPRLPSPTFVTAYLEAFRQKPAPQLPDNPSQGDQTLQKAYEAVAARDYPHAFTLVGEAIGQGLSNTDLEANAYNLSGTFKFVIGQAKDALEDLEKSTTLRPDYVQSWVKKASVHMELSDKDEAFKDFDRAAKADANDPDIYYHRGQVHFILGDYSAALSDYEKSTELDDTFIFSQVQHAVAQYKLGDVALSTRLFARLLDKFSTASEAYNYYGELLLDQQKFEEALVKFDRAIEIENNKERSTNVLPMINKALALFQWKQDMARAEQLCRRALDKDPDCDVAIATLAQLSLQQGKIKEAITYFERSAQIARTEPELVNAITYENAARAQLKFIEEFPEESRNLQALAADIGAQQAQQ